MYPAAKQPRRGTSGCLAARSGASIRRIRGRRAIRRALRRADTLAAVKSAPKRKRSAIAPDSCGKPGEPHDLEGGALVSRNSFISKKRRRELDAGWDPALTQAGSSQDHAEILD